MSIDTKRIALMLRTALALFVLLGANLATWGQEIKIVVPNNRENVEGDVDGTAGTTPYRTQQLSPASEFAALPETYRTIIGMYVRPDRTITTPRTAVANDYLTRLSTTSKSVLDTVFDENVGDDVTTVFDGPLTISTQATGPPEGPRGFDYFVEFETPFVYDPSRGRNLVADFITFSGVQPENNPDWDSSIDAVFSLNPDARMGQRFDGPVIQWVLFPDLYTGDYNGDTEFTMADIDLLSAELREAAPSKWFDLNRDGITDQEDHRVWVKDLKYTWIGDADLNGEFNSSDMVKVFSAGKYEKGWIDDMGVIHNGAGWAEGDWDATGMFDSSDMVAAFADGGYEQGPRTDVAAVPEPTAWLLFVIGLAIWLSDRRVC